jgi:outer membrane receptor protein involved in Fe transport
MRNFNITLFITCFFASYSFAQNYAVSGKILNNAGQSVDLATIALKSGIDSSLLNVEMSDMDGTYNISGLKSGDYFIEVSFLGYESEVEAFTLVNEILKLPNIIMKPSNTQLDEVMVTASRRLVEVRPDRTVFNVQGTVNSAGENVLDLMRKAPGVLVDNNDNITVLSRSGVLIYVDGKRLPLSGDDLSSYLKSITSEQIDRIDIITNPGAKYEAEGNAGIIDIIMKRDEKLGYNGAISATATQGKYRRGNTSFTGNYRNKRTNVFGNVSYNGGENWNELIFNNYQNGFLIREDNQNVSNRQAINYRIGSDFFINEYNTIGILYSGQNGQGISSTMNNSDISSANTPSQIDSILIANNSSERSRTQNSFNINYAFKKDNNSLNIDLDYGSFTRFGETNQPNEYYNNSQTQLLSARNVFYSTPVDINISTATLDYELETGKGKIGLGGKFTNVITDNTFLFFNVDDGIKTQNDSRSNRFKYNENVSAGYINYSSSVTEKIKFSGGLRVEHTNAMGDLEAFLSSLQEDPVQFNYLSFFPSLGLTYQKNPQHLWALNYGRRINRPDYNVLNPFREQMSELSFSKGNPFLRPEIVNNVELGYTYKYMYNVKVGYSLTTDQITRLIGPDILDPRAGFITWENLATQEVISINISAPIQINKWWNAYFNANGSYINNQADYGEGGIVDVQALTYSIFTQQTFNLPWSLKGEISGYYSGPGVWGGVFRYEPQYGINLGLQRKFLDEKMNIRLAFNDITYGQGWTGYSDFNGLRGEGQGNYDSRTANLSISYAFGNAKVKSRNRKTGIEDEAGRVGGR